MKVRISNGRNLKEGKVRPAFEGHQRLSRSGNRLTSRAARKRLNAQGQS